MDVHKAFERLRNDLMREGQIKAHSESAGTKLSVPLSAIIDASVGLAMMAVGNAIGRILREDREARNRAGGDLAKAAPDDGNLSVNP